jgi:hypothetical protein
MCFPIYANDLEDPRIIYSPGSKTSTSAHQSSMNERNDPRNNILKIIGMQGLNHLKMFGQCGRNYQEVHKYAAMLIHQVYLQ